MDANDFEFQISQYSEGTLPVQQRATLEARLANDPAAQKLLAEYRRLNAHLAQSFALPELNWDRLAVRLSTAVAESEGPVVVARIGETKRIGWTWRPRLAIAASVLVVLGSASFLFKNHPAPPTVNPQQLTNALAVAEVTGPQAETAEGTAVVEVSIGPSPALAAQGASWRYAEGVVTRPATIVLAGDVKPDNQTHIR